MTYEFEGFRLDAAQRQLTSPQGKPIDLPSRAFDLLLFMVEHRGALLEKSVLMKAVWPTTVVEEGNLSQCIFLLRRAFGEEGGQQKFIVTVPGRGYQFVAPLEERPAAAPPASPAPPAIPAVRRESFGWRSAAVAITTVAAVLLAFYIWPRNNSALESTGGSGTQAIPALTTIAVLPFENLSATNDLEYLENGLADEISEALGKIPGLKVTGRRSASAFKGRQIQAQTVGQRLKVANVLEGRIRKEGSHLRITALLSRTKDGLQSWTASYDGTLRDVPQIQTDIARRVVNALGPRPGSAAVPVFPVLTKSHDAYAAYLRGRFLFTRGDSDLVRASEEFKRATQADPAFALAHAWLARCYTYMAYNTAGNNTELKALAFDSMNRAVKLQPDITDLWWTDWIHESPGRMFASTATRLERALAADPSDSDAMLWLSMTYQQLGRPDESFAMLERAYQTDPLSPPVMARYAFAMYVTQGDRSRYLALADELEQIAPNTSFAGGIRATLAYNEGRAGDWDRYVTRQVEQAPRELPVQGYLSLDYSNVGAIDAALHHARLCQRINPKNAAGWYNVAHIRLFAGDIDAARSVVQEAMRLFPEDYLALQARAELQYFTGDCAGAVESLVRAQPEIGQPPAALDTLDADRVLPMLTWCLRKQGYLRRADEVAHAFEIQHSGYRLPGYLDGQRARMSAALGDRDNLVRHLKRLTNTYSMSFAFSRFEPMIQPFLADSEVQESLAKLEARRAQWRNGLAYSSTRVPVPGLSGQ